ncbi:DUF3231 family protein [Paenibacillus hexagrammi]|uniref:DUF3231 family protein n=1 Tax=Paenibacillus hexagrammi TaxID=2908839 RepID=UPI00331303A2
MVYLKLANNTIIPNFRRDITADYVRLTAETLKFADDIIKEMVEKRWLEQPPKSPDRYELAGVPVR